MEYPSLDMRASLPGCVPARRRPCFLLYRSESTGIPAPARTLETALSPAVRDNQKGSRTRPLYAANVSQTLR
jgi:hypothetical protein